MKIFFFLRFPVLLLLMLSGGCAFAGGAGGDAVQVRLAGDGRVYVGETYTGLSGLSARLRKDGVKANAMIKVEIPHNTSPDAMAAISRELASNGYRRFIFNKPRKAVAEKGLDPLLKDLHR